MDIHCHCLPAIDDGPTTMGEAIVLCRHLAADGITAVIATPHQLGRYGDRNSAAKVRAAAGDLNDALVAAGVPLRVLPGGEVRIDERIPELLAADEVVTLADRGRHLLLELPNEALINPVGLARRLALMGTAVIVAHPERCAPLRADPDRALAWLDEGIGLQLSAASLVGDAGSSAREICLYWLGEGAASVVATDAHGGLPGRPGLSAAFSAVSRHLGLTVARQAFLENPQRVLRGEEIAPPPMAAHAGIRA